MLENNEKFIDTIISQNKFINEIISFFETDLCSKTHFFNKDNNEWLDFSSILREEKYWNVDIIKVDTEEY